MHLCRRYAFSQIQALWAGAYKNRIDQSGQMEWSQFSIKIIGVSFVNSILDNSNWDKISEGIIKKIHIRSKVRLSLRGKKIIVNQIFLSKLWCLDQIYTIPKSTKRETEKII